MSRSEGTFCGEDSGGDPLLRVGEDGFIADNAGEMTGMVEGNCCAEPAGDTIGGVGAEGVGVSVAVGTEAAGIAAGTSGTLCESSMLEIGTGSALASGLGERRRVDLIDSTSASFSAVPFTACSCAGSACPG